MLVGWWCQVVRHLRKWMQVKARKLRVNVSFHGFLADPSSLELPAAPSWPGYSFFGAIVVETSHHHRTAVQRQLCFVRTFAQALMHQCTNGIWACKQQSSCPHFKVCLFTVCFPSFWGVGADGPWTNDGPVHRLRLPQVRTRTARLPAAQLQVATEVWGFRAIESLEPREEVRLGPGLIYVYGTIFLTLYHRNYYGPSPESNKLTNCIQLWKFQARVQRELGVIGPRPKFVWSNGERSRMAHKGWVCEHMSATAWCKLTWMNGDIVHRLIRYHFWTSFLDIVIFYFVSVCQRLHISHFTRNVAFC